MVEKWLVYKDNRAKGTTGCLWEISNYGRVRKNGILLTFKPGNYYIQCAGNYLHRIVTELFIGEIKEGYEVEHIDCNKHNNAISNLRIVTHKDNCGNIITRERISTGNKKYYETHPGTNTGKHLIAWNKGLTKENDERVAKCAESRLGIEPWNKGKDLGDDWSWNRGQTKETNNSLKQAGQKISQLFKGRKKDVWFDDEGKKHWKWAE